MASAKAVSAVIEPGNLDVALDASGAGSVEVFPAATTTYTVTVTFADNSNAADTAAVTVAAAPTAALSADPETIAAGQPATLTVASTNAVSAVIEPGDIAVTLDDTGAGSVSVMPTATTEYTLTVTDANGVQAIATATVAIVSAALSADPLAIVAGQSSTLTAASANAVSAVIEPGAIAVALDNTGGGSVSVSPAQTTTYVLTVTAAGGVRAVATVTVTVSDGPISPPLDPGIITTVAGTGWYGYSGDGGAATAARLRQPYGVAVDAAGNLYIADEFNHRIRKVDTGGAISTVAGSGTEGYSGDGGLATATQLNTPTGVAVDAAGNLYIADQNNQRIRKVDTGGAITTVAGTGGYGYSGDGVAATAAQLYGPYGVAVDAAGNLHIADTLNNRIRKVDTGGVITTVAGSGTKGGTAATAAQLRHPRGVAVDAAGNLYIADTLNQRIRKVDTGGAITTVAGTGTSGYSGDGGAATAAQLYKPSGVAVDAAGNLYIADFRNNRIRKVDTGGAISTVAGTGESGDGGDGGAATAAQLTWPQGVAVDSTGNLYIADTSNRRIRKVLPPVRVTLAAAPGTITSGQSATLTWSSPDAVSAAIDNGIGTVSPATGGTVEVTPTETTAYTVTVTFADDSTATATAFVTVAPVPTATLSADPAVIAAGQPATLTIASTNTQSVVINPGNHNVFRDASGAGSVTVYPTQNTEYTLTVTDANGVQAVATAAVTVITTATLSAAPATITAGQSAVLSVASTNAVSAEIDQGGWARSRWTTRARVRSPSRRRRPPPTR